MQITPSTLTFLFNNFNLKFQDAYRTAPEPWWSQIATMNPSTTAQETYAWASRSTQLRQWVGERQMRNIALYAQTIVNQDYEGTIEVDRNSILDDQLGAYNFAIDDLARASKKWPDTILLPSLRTGQSTLGFDGSNYFDTTHPVDKYPGQSGTASTQRNYWSSGMPLNFDNYQTVRATMMSYVGEDNLPLGIVPNLLVVPPQQEVIARLICEGDSVGPLVYGNASNAGVTNMAGANTNVLKGTAKVLVIPELSVDPNIWYLMDTSRGVKPFIFQQRQAPNILALTDPKSENVFKRKKYVFGVDTRGATQGSLWFLASKASN